MTATRDELAARGIRVKALEWEERNGVQIAQTSWGRYAAGLRGACWIWAWNGQDNQSSTEEAAKAAAQADYEARIFATLEVSDDK